MAVRGIVFARVPAGAPICSAIVMRASALAFRRWERLGFFGVDDIFQSVQAFSDAFKSGDDDL